jgi:UDP-N-acetylmuramate dehydrogenase
MTNGIAAGDLAELAAAMRRVVSGRVATAEPLAPLTSLRVGGPAAVCVEPAGEDDLVRVAEALTGPGGPAGRAGRGPEAPIPVLVLGRGTNLLVSDEGFAGLVIRLTAGFEWIAGDGPGGRFVDAGGGAPLPRVANYAARRSLAGMEFAVAIPATVGGGIRMNAGAHGASVSSVLSWARVLSLVTGLKQTLAAESLNLTYRSSSLTESDIVCAARFELAPGDRQEIARLMDAYRLHRSTTQPAEAPNAGSMFRNPDGVSAGSLIEAAGLKGLAVGRVEVSERHANFFLARPGATAQQVHDLMVRVQQAVEERTGVLLQPEVHIVGTFAGSDRLRRGPA